MQLQLPCLAPPRGCAPLSPESGHQSPASRHPGKGKLRSVALRLSHRTVVQCAVLYILLLKIKNYSERPKFL